MALWRPDPTFYPSARLAMEAPQERLAYVAVLNPGTGQPDAMTVVDCDPNSASYSQVVHSLEMPHVGDELHHFNWNACSAALCPSSAHPHLERRYLVVPSLANSRIYIIDTQPDPARPRIVKTIEPEQVQRAGYSRPHTVHCGPDAIYVSALGSAEGDRPGGIMMLDHYTFEPIGPWELDRGPQELAYDFWWHIGIDTMMTSEWGTPEMFEAGARLEDVVGQNYGHVLHFWDMRRRAHRQAVDLGAQHQMALELRPAHNPTRHYGFCGVVVSTEDLSGSIFVWYRDGDEWAARKVISVPAEPADAADLPPALQPLGAVPPLITDIDLSLDDRFLYVSCWGTGKLLQYDVSDPFNPVQTGELEMGGVVRKAAHPTGAALTGGPQMVEISRDGRRVYLTNSLYSSWDDQFYPDGLNGWLSRIDVNPEGGMSVNEDFFVDYGKTRTHQVRLQGGDASSDTYCFP